MEDNSFLYFIDDSILSKIDIDSRLVDSFKRVLSKIQVYFNSNGYTSDRDYKDFLEKNLLNGFRIYVGKIEKYGVLGFYDKYKKEICINEIVLSNPDILDSTLCHEFIHFLVMHCLRVNQCDDQIFYCGFINEALTEMLTQQMYPNSRGYDAQVSMMKFANFLSGNVNNYRLFLKGYIDSRLCSSEWENFIDFADKFQKDFDAVGYIDLKSASSNKNFISAQRYLISLFINTFESKSFDEYCDCIRKLIDRPVPDQEYVNRLVNSLDKKMIRDLGFNNSSLSDFFMEKLIEVRELIKASLKYDGKDVYEFDFFGEIFAIDRDLKLYGSVQQQSWDSHTMNLKKGNNFLTINLDSIDFEKRSNDIHKRLDELSLIFSKDLSRNLNMLYKAIGYSGNLLRVEKFTVPSFDGRRRNYDVFVAFYEDKVVVLNNFEKLGFSSDFNLRRYIGKTSKDNSNALIISDDLGKFNNGFLYSVLTEKMIYKFAVDEYSKVLGESISPSSLESLILRYKASDSFIESDEVREDALRFLAYKEFEKLSFDEKKKYFDLVIKNNEQFIVSVNDGIIDVGIKLGNSFYTGKRTVLYDSKSNGVYNVFYDDFVENEDLVMRHVEGISINFGNIVVSNQDRLDDIDFKVEGLRNEYRDVVFRIEDLMRSGSDDFVELLAVRDNISSQINELLSKRKNVLNNIEKSRKAIINRVERLLGFVISPVSKYVSVGSFPKQVYKSASQLESERDNICEKLRKLCSRDFISLGDYVVMSKEVNNLFDSMIFNASKTDNFDSDEFYDSDNIEMSDELEEHSFRM